VTSDDGGAPREPDPWAPLVPFVYWTVGKGAIGPLTRLLAPLRVYGRDRVPRHGGAVLAANHFHLVDAPTLGTASRRRIVFVAKMESHEVPGLGQLIRSHGTLAIRRGESDRDAIRRARETVRDNHLLGMFIEGTRQRAGVPGTAKPGAAMIAMNEGVPIVPAAIHGSQRWKLGNFAPVSVAFGEPMRFDELPRNSRGYREASVEVMAEIVRLWEFLVEMHRRGRPAAEPPRRANVPARLG
jgi:1-acyl-sn-glycerol-3-phosphate acyltransferase